ncbi:MAG: hypothetical protein AB1489_42705, partial [Acidobacteriota bacterium]
HRESSEYGWAVWLNRNFAIYFGVALLFSIGYVIIAWLTTEFPSLQGEAGEPVFAPLAFSLWWGIALHHYYLDQKIWRVSKKRDLQERFGLTV